MLTMPPRLLCLFAAILCALAWPVAIATEEPASVEVEEVEIVPASAKGAKPTETRDRPDVAQLIVDHANAFRGQQKRSKLAVSKQLTATAHDFAHYMGREHRYAHTADGRTAAERAKAHEYDYCIVLENIAYQFSTRGFTAEELARRNSQGWEESPEHRENLSDPDITEIGVGVAQSVDTGYYFAVQMLGRPKSAEISFKITNRSDSAVHYDLDGKRFDLAPRQIRTHHRCRPPKMVLHWEKPADRPPEVLAPGDNDEFAVIRTPEGALKLVQGDSSK